MTENVDKNIGDTVFYIVANSIRKGAITKIITVTTANGSTTSYHCGSIECATDDIGELHTLGERLKCHEGTDHVPDESGWVTWDFSSRDGPIGWVVNGITITENTTIVALLRDDEQYRDTVVDTDWEDDDELGDVIKFKLAN